MSVSVVKLKNYITLVGVTHMCNDSKIVVNNLLGYNSNSNFIYSKFGLLNDYHEVLVECNYETQEAIVNNKITDSEFFDLFYHIKINSPINNKIKLIDIPFYYELNYFILLNQLKCSNSNNNNKSSNDNSLNYNFNNSNNNNTNNNAFTVNYSFFNNFLNNYNKLISSKSLLSSNINTKINSNTNNNSNSSNNENVLFFNKFELDNFYHKIKNNFSNLTSKSRFISELDEANILKYEEEYNRLKERFFELSLNNDYDRFEKLVSNDSQLKLFKDTYICFREENMLCSIVDSIIKLNFSLNNFESNKNKNQLMINLDCNSNTNNNKIVVFVGSYHLNYLKNELDKLLI
jgi:hypothetical protein